MFMKGLFCIVTAPLLLVALFQIPAYAQLQPGTTCAMQWSQLVTPSPPYTACASEMKTTFAFNVFYGSGGYDAVHCLVINSGWDRYYAAMDFPQGDGQATDTWHCANRKDHRLQIDVPTGHMEPGWKFAPYYLKAEYSEDNPRSPEP
jgi:hypothetical protein